MIFLGHGNPRHAATQMLHILSRLFCSFSGQKNKMFHSRFTILLLCSKTAAVYTISPNPINLIITATKTTSVLLSAESQYAFAFLRNVPGISNDSTSLETKPDTLLQKMRVRKCSVPIGWWRFIFMKAALVLYKTWFLLLKTNREIIEHLYLGKHVDQNISMWPRGL